MARIGKLELTYLPCSRRWRKRYKRGEYFWRVKDGETKAQSYARCLRLWHIKRGELAAAEKTGESMAAELKRERAERVELLRRFDELQAVVTAMQGVRPQAMFAVVPLDRSGMPVGPTYSVTADDDGRVVAMPGVAKQPAEQPTIDRFIARKQQDVANGELSPERLKNIRHAMGALREHLGDRRIEDVTRADLEAYRDALLGKYAKSTAALMMQAVRQLFNWLEIVEPGLRLPSMRQLGVAVPPKDVEALSLADVRAMLARVTNKRHRLIVLLALNCGMLIADTNDLRRGQVKDGCLTRRRSKTRKLATAPKVTYRLWPETLALVEQVGARSGEMLMPGSLEGASLNLRVRHRVGVRELRKAAGAAIYAHTGDRETAELFLAHSAKGVGMRHYLPAHFTKLDAALDWLGRELGQVK